MRNFLFLCVACVSALASAASWFDAGVKDYAEWPSNAQPKVVSGVGTWTQTRAATLEGEAGARRLAFGATAQAPLEFAPDAVRSADDELSVSFGVLFTPGHQLEAPLADMKGAVTVAFDANEVPVYYGLAKDAAGTTNVWTALTGATPKTNEHVTVEISVRKENGVRQVHYAVDGAELATASGAWTEIAFPDADDEVRAMGCYGTGELSALAGATAVARPTVALTIPALDRLTVETVRAGGLVVTNEGGVYRVPQGESVVVTFTPADGYVLASREMVFALSADGTLPVAGRPEPVLAADVLRINEAQASNGDTCRTASGQEGLDWIELRNAADFAIDVTGWYLHDDAEEKKKNWKKIKGTCVIPAHGYAVVWADKDFEGFTPEEAYVKIGLGTGGESIFLAAPGGTVVDTLTFKRQIKDVSVGRGHVSRTVLASDADAEYRVGTGAWQPATGPIGMSETTEGGFTVVTYFMNTTINNADNAEAFVADPSYWKANPVTNVCETLAFTASSGGKDANFTYANFPGGSADNMVLVVTGSVYIPRAGQWTFAGGSDDGFTATLSRLERSWTWEWRSTRSWQVTYSTFSLPEPGVYALRALYFDKSGGKTFDISVREGEHDYADGEFQLLGGTASGVVHAGALGASLAVDLADAMKGVTAEAEWRADFALTEPVATGDVFRLRMRYADGFTAKVNGETVVSVAATRARMPVEALTAVDFILPSGLVTQGVNRVEVTGVNNAVDDGEFFLSPEIVWEPAEEGLVYFTAPTPGAVNAGSGLDAPTPEVQFSVPHGYKTEPFDLVLSCPDDPTAAIYYTLDGTSPTTGATRYTEPIHITGTTVVRAAVPDARSVLQSDASATYLFVEQILQQSATAPAHFPTNGEINSQKMAYEMNASVVAANRAKLLNGFTNTIATLSLVIDPANLFDKSKGIYVNATGNGRSWERATLLELFSPTNAAESFSVPAGLRIRGAYSRGSSYPKHSFRLFFRSEYGLGKLEYPLFGDAGAGHFDKIDLRTAQNNSWANNDTYASQFTFIEECFSRDTQRDLGESHSRSRYYNLFINGVYWGVYQTEERISQDYGETYFGGAAEDYDVVRTSQPGYVTGVVEGTDDAWHDFWNLTVNEGFGGAYSNNYFKAQGLNPDGTRNVAYPAYLNLTNIMAFVLSTHYAADKDCPSNGTRANNMAALYNRTDAGTKAGWLFNRHDAEHSMGMHGTSVSFNNTLYGTDAQNAAFLTQANFNPCEIHYRLATNLEYRTAFADYVYRECLRAGGALTVSNATARFRARMAELDDAVTCESARWGWGKYTYETWTSACGTCLTFIQNRLANLIPQYRTRGWYPSIDPPSVVDGTAAAVADGARVAYGAHVYLTGGTAGTVYYTTDGSDPRRAGGAVSPSAQVYTGGSPEPTYVSVFSRTTGGWQYFDWGAEPAADGAGRSWTSPDYNTNCVAAQPWGVGKGILGFNGTTASETIGTTLAKYADHAASGTQVYTYYFRRAFTAPAAATNAASVQLNILFDDCYAVYLNGTEIDRQFLAADAGYSTFALNGSAHKVSETRTVTIPKGLLRAGTNVLAVEVHQNQSASSDIYFDLGLAYQAAASATGGYEVPAAGVNLKMRVRTAAGEWSALETVSLFGSASPEYADPSDAVRVAAVMSVTTDGGVEEGDGDGSEWIALTNITANPVQLAGVRVTCAKTKKGKVDDPKCDVTLPAGLTLAAGGSIVLAKADYWPSGKITNGEVEMRLYAPDGTTVQSLYFDSAWWDGACDGTGEHFIARTFGAEVREQADWTTSFTAPAEAPGAVALDAAAAAGGDAVREWLAGLAADTKEGGGRAKLAAFAGTAETVARCYLVNVPPEMDPEIEVTIPAIAIGADGSVQVSGALALHGEETEHTVNGEIRLYHAETLEGLSTATDPISLGRTFPVTPQSVEVPATASRFFLLRVE